MSRAGAGDYSPRPLHAAAVIAFTSLVLGETCPAPTDVEQRVRAILHLSAEQRLDESFLVERHEAGLFVELRGVDSTIIGQRTLPSDGSCDELAQAAAVVLSAWLTDVHPDFAGALPKPEPASEPEPVPAKAPEPAPLPTPVAASDAPARVTALAPSPPPVRRGSLHWELSLGAGADMTARQLALAGLASLAYLPAKSGWGAGLYVLLDGSRRQSLGAGAVSWSRWPVACGPTLRVASSWMTLDFSAGPALSWVRLGGRDFDDNSSYSTPSWSGFFSARLASGGPFGVFGQGLGQVYLGRPTAVFGEAEYRLPRVGAAVLLGAHWSP